MSRELQGKRIAILATDGVERIELEQPRGALYGAGATSELLSIHPGEIQDRQFDMVSAGTFPVDREVSDASVDDYDALLLPGGTCACRIGHPCEATWVYSWISTPPGWPLTCIYRS